MKNALRFLLALVALSAARAADVPISGLPAASTVSSSNLTIVVDTSEPTPALRTKKATVAQLVDGLPAASAGNRGTMSAADKIKLDAATASATPSAIVSRDGSGNTALNSIALVTGTISSAPANPTDLTNKAYVDAVSTGLAVHTPAKVATLGNVTLAGGAPSTVDGIALSTNDRVLVKSQTDPKQNGIYFVQTLGSGANGTWVRTTDANSGSNLVSGSYVFINQGATWTSSAWVMTTPGAITIGVSDINWTLFNQVTNILASNIIGQIVQAQIADASINTAKFAASLEPVSIVSSLPSPSGYTGPRNLFNTADSKLYRYTGSAFVATTAAADVTGQITSTQITDSSITTAKIAAGAVTASSIAADTITAGQIAAGAITSSELAANSVIAGKIAAGTITTSEIAAATILASNIAAGTITADRMNVSSLSAISANLGTITAGTISAVTINSSTINSPSGTIGGFTLAVNSMFSNSSNYNLSLNPATGGNPGSVVMQYSGANYVSLTETTAGGLLNLGKVGNSANIQLVGQTGAMTGVTLTATGAVTGGSLVSNNTLTVASTITAGSDITTSGDIHLGTGGTNRWLYDGNGQRVIQQRYSGTPVTLSDVIAVLQYHGLSN